MQQAQILVVWVLMVDTLREREWMKEMKQMPSLSIFGRCVMDLARKRSIKTQAALRRRLLSSGYEVHDRTLANYLYGRTVVDPVLPGHLASALKLNKKERGKLAECYTFGQPPRGAELRQAG